MNIRKATTDDLDIVTNIESTCFPPAEAAPREAFKERPDGAWQMIFGLNTMPAYRNRGVGGQLIEAFIELAKEENRNGVILTCKEEKIHYYAKFGFVNEGESVSDHGGAK